jgi:hypothetical protein
MTDLFLIAHKVRGEAAFDVAQHMTCPKCNATDDHCTACDGVGHWWIIPTSGHRAYPYWDLLLNDLIDPVYHALCEMPPDLRDHYTTTSEAAFNLTKALGLDKPKPQAPIARRF